MNNNRYMMRGVSATKEDVHNAIKNIDKGLYPKAFCKIIPDILGGDPDYCNIMHADGPNAWGKTKPGSHRTVLSAGNCKWYRCILFLRRSRSYFKRSDVPRICISMVHHSLFSGIGELRPKSWTQSQMQWEKRVIL